MASVQPRGTSHDLAAAALRQGTRFVAIAAYTVAVAVAFVLLSPVLPSRGSEASEVVPTGPEPELYTVARGATPGKRSRNPPIAGGGPKRGLVEGRAPRRPNGARRSGRRA